MTTDKPLVTGLSPRQCLCLKLRPGEIMLQWLDKFLFLSGSWPSFKRRSLGLMDTYDWQRTPQGTFMCLVMKLCPPSLH
jgi:hypothetical protein